MKPVPKKRRLASKPAPKPAPKPAAKKRKPTPKPPPKRRPSSKNIFLRGKLTSARQLRAAELQATRQARAEAKTHTKVAAVVDAQQKARGTKKGSRAKQAIRAEERGIERARAKAALVTQQLPRRTPKERAASTKTVRQGMRERYRELLEHAQATGQTPARVPTGRFESYENEGDRVYVRVERILELSSVEAIAYKCGNAAMRLRGNRGLWYASLHLSGMGDRLFASGQKMLDTTTLKGSHDRAEHFQVQGFENTGVWNSRESLLAALDNELENLAATPNTVVYLHAVLIKNYDRKRKG